MAGNKKARKAVRYLVDMAVEVRGERGKFLGKARDITVEGIRMRVTTRVRIEERIGFTFKMAGDKEEWSIPGSVRWVTDADAAGEMQFGAQFDHTPETEKRMRALIWKLETGEAKQIERRHKTVRRVIPPNK